MSHKIKKYRCYLLIAGVLVLSAVSFFKPEYAEEVARAFVLLCGAWL